MVDHSSRPSDGSRPRKSTTAQKRSHTNRGASVPGKPPASSKGKGIRKPVRARPNVPPPGLLNYRRLDKQTIEFIPSRPAHDRELDLEDVRDAIAQGEFELAEDELLYLVSDCREFWPAYLLLAELALEGNDLLMAQGHFGFVYENGLRSLPQGFRGALPSRLTYNGHFFAAGRGLARCLIARGDTLRGQEVLRNLRAFDPQEPETLSLWQQLQDKLREGPLTMVDDGADDEDDGPDAVPGLPILE